MVKKNLKESLAIIAKGNKLDYGSANNLLHSVLRALNLEDSSVEDEIAPAITQLADDFNSLPSQLPPATLTPTMGVNPKAEKAAPNQNQNKTKEICRFYTRGHCNRGGECRFEHPTICKKFRQFGNKSSDPKGCEGNCDTFHPNACRGSLFNRACSFKDCRFFHLKGTKMINHDQNKASNQNWRSTQHTGSGSNQNRSKAESKNRLAGLNQTSKIRKKKKQNPVPNTKSTPDAKVEQVTKEEKQQLGQTLDAIMKRLSAMESRQTMYSLPAGQPHPQVQPLLTPAAHQPGTQTQFQWGSPNPWTQTQH